MPFTSTYYGELPSNIDDPIPLHDPSLHQQQCSERFYTINNLLAESSDKSKFYTPSPLAAHCLNLLKNVLSSHGSDQQGDNKTNNNVADVVGNNFFYIEPAAGKGAFYDLLPPDRRVGVEIDHSLAYKGYKYAQIHNNNTGNPQQSNHKYLEQLGGFLLLNEADLGIQHIPRELRVVVGNPPFSIRSKQFQPDGKRYVVGGTINICLKFFQHACTIADTVAFIVGKNARRPKFFNAIPKTFELVLDQDLPDVDYEIPTSTSCVIHKHHIHTIFQIWRKKSAYIDTNTHFVSPSPVPTTIHKIYQGKWFQDDWCIVFPIDPSANMMIRRWATMKLGQVITDPTTIESERRKAMYKEKSRRRLKLGRTDFSFFFLKVPHNMLEGVANRFRQRRSLFLKLKMLASGNSYCLNQQQLLDIYLQPITIDNDHNTNNHISIDHQ